jgi:sugar phosphate isomerase/epimerase
LRGVSNNITMKVSLNSARIGSVSGLLELVDIAAKHGFVGVDFGIGSAMKVAQELGGMNALKDTLAAKNVAPAVHGIELEWRKDEETFQTGLKELPAKAKAAQELGSMRCCTWMLPATNENPGIWGARAARRFTQIANILGDHGVSFGLEWVGPHHLRVGGVNATGANKFLETMPETLDFIAEMGTENVGLLVDSYHCYTTGATEDDLANLIDSQITHVHINDAPKGVGPSGARDGERVLPGAGEIDLAGFLSGLKKANYTGYISCEVLAPQDIAASADESAALIRASLQRLGL